MRGRGCLEHSWASLGPHIPPVAQRAQEPQAPMAQHALQVASGARSPGHHSAYYRLCATCDSAQPRGAGPRPQGPSQGTYPCPSGMARKWPWASEGSLEPLMHTTTLPGSGRRKGPFTVEVAGNLPCADVSGYLQQHTAIAACVAVRQSTVSQPQEGLGGPWKAQGALFSRAHARSVRGLPVSPLKGTEGPTPPLHRCLHPAS